MPKLIIFYLLRVAETKKSKNQLKNLLTLFLYLVVCIVVGNFLFCRVKMYKQVLLTAAEIALLTSIIDRYLQDTRYKDSNAHIIKRTLNGNKSHK